jgi:hypothetical protein
MKWGCLRMKLQVFHMVWCVHMNGSAFENANRARFRLNWFRYRTMAATYNKKTGRGLIASAGFI